MLAFTRGTILSVALIASLLLSTVLSSHIVYGLHFHTLWGYAARRQLATALPARTLQAAQQQANTEYCQDGDFNQLYQTIDSDLKPWASSGISKELMDWVYGDFTKWPVRSKGVGICFQGGIPYITTDPKLFKTVGHHKVGPRTQHDVPRRPAQSRPVWWGEGLPKQIPSWSTCLCLGSHTAAGGTHKTRGNRLRCQVITKMLVTAHEEDVGAIREWPWGLVQSVGVHYAGLLLP